ncbi:MAG TPA: hypothetical protein VN372_09565 [Methanospirillum sp.]|nr:hypothetical protein [Methanospirillum sp.]
MKKILFWLIIIAFLITPALAGTVTLKVGQSDFSFPVGKEARIPFIVESSFPVTTVGTLNYILTEKQSGGGFSLSQSSSQSQSFPISPAKSENAITLNSEVPTDFEVSLTFQYRDEGKEYAAALPPLQVHFREEQSQGQEKENQTGQNSAPLTSTTSQVSKPGPGQGQQDPFAQMDEQMNAIHQQNQQMMQQVLASQGFQRNQQSQSGSGNPDQSLVNNQMSAPATALQQQLAQEADEQQQNQQALAETIARDPIMQNLSHSLNLAGYQQKTGTSVTPKGKNDGAFSQYFENSTGHQVQTEGKVQNGKISNLNASSSGSLPIPPELSSDPRYIEKKEGLEQEGFTPGRESRIITPNETKNEEQYQTPDGKNATLSVSIINGTVTDVTVRKDENTLMGWYTGLFLLVILALLCIWAGLRYYQKRKADEGLEESTQLPELRDYRQETEMLLQEAEKAERSGYLKDAYSLTGQACRHYITHIYGDGSAMTNEEIQRVIKHSNIPKYQIMDILDTCNLVEFAKGETSESELNSYISMVREMIKE